MGEAKAKEQRLKNMTLAQLTAAINGQVVDIVKEAVEGRLQHHMATLLPELEKMVEQRVVKHTREAIKEYHEWLVKSGKVKMVEPGSDKPKLHLPAHIAADYYGHDGGSPSGPELVTDEGIHPEAER